MPDSGAGGLSAGGRAGQHNDFCPGAAHLLGGILHPPGVAVLAQLCQRLRTAGCYVIQVYFNQSFRYQIVIIKLSHSFFPFQYLRKALDILVRILKIEDALHPFASIGHQFGAAARTGRKDGLDFLHDIDIIVTLVTRLAPAHVFQILQRILLPVKVIGAVARLGQQMALFQHGGYVRVVVLLLILNDDAGRPLEGKGVDGDILRLQGNGLPQAVLKALHVSPGRPAMRSMLMSSCPARRASA